MKVPNSVEASLLKYYYLVKGEICIRLRLKWPLEQQFTTLMARECINMDRDQFLKRISYNRMLDYGYILP